MEGFDFTSYKLITQHLGVWINSHYQIINLGHKKLEKSQHRKELLKKLKLKLVKL